MFHFKIVGIEMILMITGLRGDLYHWFYDYLDILESASQMFNNVLDISKLFLDGATTFNTTSLRITTKSLH
jgi:hypothetical protein